jgi:NADPH-dependent glutamate synthase beta subunit-like oxidoreductase
VAELDPRSERPRAPQVFVTGEEPTGIRGFLESWRSLATGLRLTARASTTKPKTVRYPAEKVTLSPRWRGALALRGVLGRDEVPIVRAPSVEYNALIESLYVTDRLAPCVGNCPANVDARGQNYYVAENDPVSAYRLVRERNILPGVLGRICHHPCETACRRNFYDEPIAVRPLHRHIAEEWAKVRDELVEPIEPDRPERIAVIGSGPSGLAAALDLMKLGYSVVMFEKEQAPGGALYTGVPTYRLPRDVLHAEIGDLVRMGLDLRLGVEVGKDVQLPDLVEEFEAVLIAAGLAVSRILPIDGTDAEGVRGALEFLRRANFDKETGVTGQRVLVIGGGNVAVDVARCAVRTGAAEVSLACLEGEDEMPCHPWEIEEAVDEGVAAMCGQGPEAVIVEDGRVVGMRLRECLSVFDSQGRFSPQFGEGMTEFPCDVVVFAIGQMSVLEDMVEDTDVEVNERGQLVVDGHLFTTTSPRVFACGEVVTGPGSAIASIATGHEAATSIHRYLSGQSLKMDRVDRPVPVYYKYAAAEVDDVEPSRRRAEMPMERPEERAQDFRPVELGLTRQEALADAQRCLRCESEVCVGCTFCARTCPDLAIQVERVDEPGVRCLTRYDLDLSKCCYCGLCAEQCPTNALRHTGQYELSFYTRDLMVFDKGEMLRDPDGTRATGKDGILPPPCPSPGGEPE